MGEKGDGGRRMGRGMADSPSTASFDMKNPPAAANSCWVTAGDC